MGRPKLLLPWGVTSVLGHQLDAWQQLSAGQVAVVCAGDAAMYAELDRLGFPLEQRILNPQPERGMFSSIRCAAQWQGWAAGLTHWVISLGDQPHLRQTTLTALLIFSADFPESVCQPLAGRHRRHPVILPKAIFQQLAESPATTLRDFLATCPGAAAGCVVEDPGLDLDMDTPADYERAWRLHLGAA